MKKFVFTVALAALALMPVTAQARGTSRSSDRRGNTTRVERLENKNGMGHVRHMKMDRKRPSLGTRFNTRPIGGKYYMKGHDRLWLVDGVLYKEIFVGGRKVFVVVDYLF